MQKYKLQISALIGLAWIFASTQVCIAQQDTSGVCSVGGGDSDTQYACTDANDCHTNGNPVETASWMKCPTGTSCVSAQYGDGVSCVSKTTGASVKTFRNTQR